MLKATSLAWPGAFCAIGTYQKRSPEAPFCFSFLPQQDRMKLNDAVAVSLKLDGRIDVIAFDDESDGFGLRLRRSITAMGSQRGGLAYDNDMAAVAALPEGQAR